MFSISETTEPVATPATVQRANLYHAMSRAFVLPDEMGPKDPEWLRDAGASIHGEFKDLVLATARQWEIALAEPEELNIAHARLFLGPFEIPAPPYASIYLDPQQRLMGEVSQYVANLYREAGLEPAARPQEVPDHIRLEFEFLYYLEFKWIETGAAIWKDRRQHFINSHLSRWIPTFAEKIMQADLHPFYSAVARLIHQTDQTGSA